MSNDRAIIFSEIRYAERLCQRTARLYRHVQGFGTWLAVIGTSGTLAALANNIPNWVPIAGAIVLASTGAVLIAMRPADKAAISEADAKRYAALRTRGSGLDDKELRAALEEARQSDVAEFESLRDVAWNDVVQEVGHADKKVMLSMPQRFMAAIA